MSNKTNEILTCFLIQGFFDNNCLTLLLPLLKTCAVILYWYIRCAELPDFIEQKIFNNVTNQKILFVLLKLRNNQIE